MVEILFKRVGDGIACLCLASIVPRLDRTGRRQQFAAAVRLKLQHRFQETGMPDDRHSFLARLCPRLLVFQAEKIEALGDVGQTFRLVAIVLFNQAKQLIRYRRQFHRVHVKRKVFVVLRGVFRICRLHRRQIDRNAPVRELDADQFAFRIGLKTTKTFDREPDRWKFRGGFRRRLANGGRSGHQFVTPA